MSLNMDSGLHWRGSVISECCVYKLIWGYAFITGDYDTNIQHMDLHASCILREWSEANEDQSQQ